MSEVVLPELHWVPTAAEGSRGGSPVDIVVVHRWGVRYVSSRGEARDYEGVVRYFLNPSNRASAHVVFPGSAVLGKATQMVHWNRMAWAEAAYNPIADDIESADGIWLGKDAQGLRVLARIVAYRIHKHGLPCVWSHHRGFCRHADLGAAGGGHLQCPTTDISLWRHFVSLVQAEHQRGEFRHSWGH